MAPGEEECEPVDPCKEKKCAGGEVCKVFGEKAYCKRENAACAGCKGVRVVDANGEGKCTATDVCASVRCQLGTACVDVKGSAKCLPRAVGNYAGEGEKKKKEEKKVVCVVFRRGPILTGFSGTPMC